MRLVQVAQTDLPAIAVGDLAMIRSTGNAVAYPREPVRDEVYAAYAEQLAYRPGELEATEPTEVATSERGSGSA